jgi:CHRD domain-containing protein
MRNRRLVATVASFSTLGLVVGAGITALMEPAGAGYGATARYQTTLTGAKEAPGPGDPDGTGVAAVKVKQSTATVCVVIKMVKNLALPATAAHIHEGAVGVAGPIRLTLAPPTSKKPGRTGKSKSCATVGATLLTNLLSYPANFYVNVHTTQFPSGAIRGQLG